MERRRNAMLDNLRMDYHWGIIRLCRNRARRLIDKGTPCNDHRLVSISNRIQQHGIKVSRIWRGNSSKSTPSLHAETIDQVTA